jgi:hypothetical protein
MNEITHLHSQGLTNIQIAKLTNCKIKSVRTILNRNHLKSNRYIQVIETDELTQLLIGSVLGDGYFCKISGFAKNSRLSIAHSEKQKDYIIYKRSLLEKHNLAGKLQISNKFDSRLKNKNWIEYRFKSLTHPIFSQFRNNWYINNKKKLFLDDFNKINGLGLAIWFMDDGQCSTSSYQINTQSFLKEEILSMINILYLKFQIECTVDKTNVLYIRTNSIDKFHYLIKPFMHPSMMYKLKH